MMDALPCNVLITLVLFTFIIAVVMKIQEVEEMHKDRYAEEVRIRKREAGTTATETCTSVNTGKKILNKRLIGHELLNRSAENIIECVKWCLSYSACHSFGFYKPNKQCTLHDVNTSSIDANETEVFNGFIFSDITVWNESQSLVQPLVGGCASRPCSFNQRCFPNLLNYVCINIDCGRTPRVPYSTQNSSSTQYGSVLKYMCNEGSVMTGEATVRCMANAQWTTIPECKRAKEYYCGDLEDYTQHDLNKDGFNIDKRTSIIFLAKGKSDLHCLLQYDEKDYSRGVEIILGGWINTRSEIRTKPHDSKSTVSNFTGAVCDGTSYKPFWISWKNNCVQVGRGSTVGSDIIMHWCGLMSNIVNMRISYGWGYDGYFRIAM